MLTDCADRTFIAPLPRTRAQLLSLGIGGARPTVPVCLESVSQSLQQYVRCSAFVLLRMKICSTNATAGFIGYPVRAMFVFLEGFVHRR